MSCTLLQEQSSGCTDQLLHMTFFARRAVKVCMSGITAAGPCCRPAACDQAAACTPAARCRAYRVQTRISSHMQHGADRHVADRASPDIGRNPCC